MELTSKRVLPTKILLQKPKKEEKTTSSGLIIIESVEEVTSEGTVIVCGEGTEALPMPLKPGFKVMFPPRAVIKVRVDDEDYFLLDIRDVLLYWAES